MFSFSSSVPKCTQQVPLKWKEVLGYAKSLVLNMSRYASPPSYLDWAVTAPICTVPEPPSYSAGWCAPQLVLHRSYWCAVAEGYQNDWSRSSWCMRRCWERGLISLDKKHLKGDLVRRCKGEAENFPQRNKRQWPWEIFTHYMEKKFHREGGQTPGKSFREVADLCPWRYLKLSWPCSEHDFGQETSRSPVLTLWLCDKAGQRLRCLCKVYCTL